MFRKASNDVWCIASWQVMAGQQGTRVTISKKDGSTVSEEVGAFVEQDSHGYYLYAIAKASKWKRKNAGVGGISLDDF